MVTIDGMADSAQTAFRGDPTENAAPHSLHPEAAAPPAISSDEHFRWRAGEMTRLEAFSDVIFGFAITLLVVSLEVPHSYAELMADLRGFLPFAACFAQLAMIWRTHYKFSRRYGLEDPYTVFLNVVLLFLVLFYVYPLKFLFTLLFSDLTGAEIRGTFGWHEGSVLMRVYSLGFALVFLLFVLMYARAYGFRRELALNPVEVQGTLFSLRENAILALVGTTSFVTAFRYPGAAGWMYCALGPLLWMHGTISGKRLRRLSEQIAAAS